MYWLLTENCVLNANILVFMLIHTELFSNVSGFGLEKIFGPWPRPWPHSFWPRPRPRPWPHAQLALLTSLKSTSTIFLIVQNLYKILCQHGMLDKKSQRIVVQGLPRTSVHVSYYILLFRECCSRCRFRPYDSVIIHFMR